VSPCPGVFAASGLLRVLSPGHAALGATPPAGGPWQAFASEVGFTLVFMSVTLRVSTGAKSEGITAGIAVGAVVGSEAMYAGPVCGA